MTYDQIASYLTKLRQLDRDNIIIYEWGVQSCNGVIRCFELANKPKFKINIRHIFGFDSFEGLPAEQPGLDIHTDFHIGQQKGESLEWCQNRCKGLPVTLIKGWFSDLDVTTKGMVFEPADAINLDGDLYISTYQALDWMCKHNLIKVGTMLSYNEWNSVTNGGEKMAHEHICEKYKMEVDNFWTDDQGLVQKNFIVTKV